MALKSSIIVFPTLLPEFEYHRPKDLSEALELLNKYAGEAAILNGGTDLILDMRLRVKEPKHLIDIKGIKELRRLEYEPGNGLTIGATITYTELLNFPPIKEKYYVLWDSASKVADIQLRNKGTIVGNICNASPAADTAPALLVLDAKVEVRSVEGSKIMELKDFFKWVKKTALKPNEMVTSIIVPEPPEGAKGEYFKVQRSAEDIAVVGIAILVANPKDPAKRIVRLAYASVAPTPVRIYEVEEIFKKDKPVPELIEEAVEVVKKAVSPITDVRATKEYREYIVEYGTRYLLSKYLGGE